MKTKRKSIFRRSGHRSQNRILQQTEVYLMHDVPHFWLNKIGISDETSQRRRDVSETTLGFIFYVLSPRLAFGYELEGFIHALYAPLRVMRAKGSGRSEWFIVLNPIVGTSVFFLNGYFEMGLNYKLLCLAYFMPFVWLDGVFWLVFFWAFYVLAVVGVFLATVYFLK